MIYSYSEKGYQIQNVDHTCRIIYAIEGYEKYGTVKGKDLCPVMTQIKFCCRPL